MIKKEHKEIAAAAAIAPVAAAKQVVTKPIETTREAISDIARAKMLTQKYNLHPAYYAIGTEAVHGAASVHDKSIKVKHAYSPNTVAARSLQRAAMGALSGLAVSYFQHHENPDASTLGADAAKGAALGALVGATLGPAVVYGGGKLAEHIRQKIIQKRKSNAKK
jgi:hypothetical protein